MTALSYADGPAVLFRWQRVHRAGDIPPADERVIDLALLDMNHAWPNLGHDAILRTVGEIAEDVRPLLEETGLRFRVLSYDVRRSLAVPESPGRRHRIYLGTGGPGHIDPRLNDAVAEYCQGIKEDPAWEAPMFRLLDAIISDPHAVLLAVCHMFGVICRWSGAARPVLRGPEKGGKSAGVVENALTPAARRHPWFSRFAAELRDGVHLRILDNRLFDLIPTPGGLPAGCTAISYERADGHPEDPVTMLEFAVDRAGILPRVFAVNHHPEIRNRWRQRWLLQRKLERGEVTRDWYEERAGSIAAAFSTPELEREVMLTSQFTFVAPLRYHLYREVRLRAEALGRRPALHEDHVLLPSGTLDHEESV